ncbi:hypothetical protein FQZ97_578690 [compost metagenome]
MEPTLDWLEDAGYRITDQQPTGGDSKERAVQFELAALNKASNPGEGHQILEAKFDRSEFELAQIDVMKACTPNSSAALVPCWVSPCRS